MANILKLSFIVLMLGLAGCNTVEGVGEDMQEAGEQIEDDVED